MKLTGFIAAAVLTLSAAGAQALPIDRALSTGTDASIVQVAGGCGFGAHRGPYGGCRLNNGPRGYIRGMMGGRPRGCGPGFHRSGRGFCVRNFY